jgi:hypothetical protein
MALEPRRGDSQAVRQYGFDGQSHGEQVQSGILDASHGHAGPMR